MSSDAASRARNGSHIWRVVVTTPSHTAYLDDALPLPIEGWKDYLGPWVRRRNAVTRLEELKKYYNDAPWRKSWEPKRTFQLQKAKIEWEDDDV